jgi:hypothetical protein
MHDLLQDFMGSKIADKSCVPVWQNLQVSVQPTCDKRKASAFGLRNEYSFVYCPSDMASNHLIVPSMILFGNYGWAFNRYFQPKERAYPGQVGHRFKIAPR